MTPDQPDSPRAGSPAPAIARLGTILGVWAHPDDEAYLSAGLMAMARDAGQRVACVTATRGGSAPPIRCAGHPSASPGGARPSCARRSQPSA